MCPFCHAIESRLVQVRPLFRSSTSCASTCLIGTTHRHDHQTAYTLGQLDTTQLRHSFGDLIRKLKDHSCHVLYSPETSFDRGLAEWIAFALGNVLSALCVPLISDFRRRLTDRFR